MTLPASYDAWRLSAPEAPELHPGPHQHNLCIETAEVCIDAIGIYDGDGNLTAVMIEGKEIAPEKVQAALDLLGLDSYDNWSRPLDPDTLADLSAEAFDAEAEMQAYYRRRNHDLMSLPDGDAA
jgi:hypothetical protein